MIKELEDKVPAVARKLVKELATICKLTKAHPYGTHIA